MTHLTLSDYSTYVIGMLVATVVGVIWAIASWVKNR